MQGIQNPNKQLDRELSKILNRIDSTKTYTQNNISEIKELLNKGADVEIIVDEPKGF